MFQVIVPLCKKCHNQVHSNQIVIRGYRETYAGVELDYTLVSETKQSADKTRKKFTDAQVDTRSVSLQAKWKTQKLLQEYLEKEHDIVVSNAISQNQGW